MKRIKEWWNKWDTYTKKQRFWLTLLAILCGFALGILITG